MVGRAAGTYRLFPSITGQYRLVRKGHLNRHAILCDHRLFKDFARFLHQLFRTDRITRRHVRQHQAPSLRGERHLSGFARRRMPRLLRPLLLLLPKRRLVNQEISPLRRIHDRRAGPRVAGKHYQPPRTLRPDNAVRGHCPPVRQSHRLTSLQLPPQVSFRNARRARLLRIKPPRTLVLLERVPDRPPPMLRGEGVDRIPVATSASPNLHNLPRLDFNDLDFERDSLDAELKRLREQLLRPLW